MAVFLPPSPTDIISTASLKKQISEFGEEVKKELMKCNVFKREYKVDYKYFHILVVRAYIKEAEKGNNDVGYGYWKYELLRGILTINCPIYLQGTIIPWQEL